MPRSAIDSISPAFEHTRSQLFRPFRFGQWARLALVGLFAGEMTSGGCNMHSPGRGGGVSHGHFGLGMPTDWALLVGLIVLAVIAVPVLWLLFLYISSRMRFVLFDTILARSCQFQRMWQARRGPAFEYFAWQILLSLAILVGTAALVGIPVLMALLLGWLTAPRTHLAPLILTGALVLPVLLVWMLLSVVVHVFTKDFVVPQMALENLSAFEGWRRLWKMLRAERAGYAGYAALKLLLAVVAGAGVAAVAVVVVVALLIPFGGLGALAVLGAGAAGLTWNIFTITVAVVAGCLLLLVVLYAVAFISVPVIVFFPAYSIHFFAARYDELARRLYPLSPPAPPPIAPAPGAT